MFFSGDKKRPFLSADAVYDQLLGSDELCQTERAKGIVLLAGFQRIVDKNSDLLVDRELSSIDMELARSYLNLRLEMPLMGSGKIPEANVQGAILNHFYQVTNLISGLKPNLLSTSFVESPVILEMSIAKSYELGNKREAVEFDKLMGHSFPVVKLINTLSVAHLAHLRATLPNWQVRVKNVLSSNKGGFDYDMHLENLVESLTRHSQNFFKQMHDRRIESKCSVLYHWLPSSLNWNKKCVSDGFLRLELSVSCRGGGMSMRKAMEETLLNNTALQIVIATNCATSKQLSYPMHLVDKLATETVGHTISTAVDLQLLKAIIVHALLLGLSFWVVVLHFIAVLKKLLVMGINSNGLITVFVEDFSNKKFLICCPLTTAESRTFVGQFRSLKENKLDGRLNLRVLCISRMELGHVDISCITDTSGKQLENSPFCEQLKKHYGVFCLAILAEGYLTTFLLYFEDSIFHNWSNMSSKIGACIIIELPQCMNKMQSFPLDSISWKLVVIKHVKAVLQVNVFYSYVQWVVVPLVIIHFGSRFFPFLCECVDHSSTDIENPTVIIRGARDDNLLHCKMATGTLGHLNLHGHLEFKDEEAAPNALDGLTGLLRHDTRIYVSYLLDIPEMTVAWQNSKFHLLVYINVSTSILAIRNTLVSANSTTSLRHTTNWDVMLILHGPCFKVSLLSLFEIVPQQLYETTLAEKVIQDQATLHNVESAFLCFKNMEFWRVKWFVEHVGTDAVSRTRKWNWFSDKVGVTIILDMALFEYPVRATTINAHFHNLTTFAHRPTLELRLHGCGNIFGGLHADNNLAMLPECLPFYIGAFCFHATVIMRIGQLTSKAHTHCDLALLFGEGPEQYLIRSFVVDATAHMLLVVNPGDVVVKKVMLPLSSYKLLICAMVMQETIVVAHAKMNKPRGKLIVDALITTNMLPTGSCGDWDAKVAFGFHDGMLNEIVKSPENLINEESSNVAVHTKAPWLQLEGIRSNFRLTTILRHEDMPSFKGRGMIGSLGYGVALLN